MAKKDDQTIPHSENANGEISTIRDILMGHKISENEVRFEAIEARIEQMELSFNDKMKDLESKFEAHYQRLNNDSEQRFDNLEKTFSASQQQFHEKIQTLRRQERENLSNLLSQLSKNLLDD